MKIMFNERGIDTDSELLQPVYSPCKSNREKLLEDGD